MNLVLYFFHKAKNFKFLVVILFLTGCAVTSKTLKKKNVTNSVELQEVVDRITSIPDTPFGFVPIQIYYDQSQNDNIQIVYVPIKSNKQSFEQIVDVLFRGYEMSMETLGWNLMHRMHVQNSLMLLFNRPDKTLCQINFNADKVLTVTLFYDHSNKKGL